MQGFFKTKFMPGIKKLSDSIRTESIGTQNESYSDPFIDKSYNIMGRVNSSGVQLVSSVKIIKPGSSQIVDTATGTERQEAQLGDVLLTNPSGKKSLVPAGEIAKNYFIDNLTKKVLTAVAQDALENNQGKYIENDGVNILYEVKGKRYVTTPELREKLSGLVDESKNRTISSAYKKCTDVISTIC